MALMPESENQENPNWGAILKLSGAIAGPFVLGFLFGIANGESLEKSVLFGVAAEGATWGAIVLATTFWILSGKSS